MKVKASRITSRICAVSGRSKTANDKKIPSAKSVPISWANLLGGPGTRFSFFKTKGTTNLVAICPIGLSVGPVNNLATKPYSSKAESHVDPVMSIPMTSSRTINATDRAAYSFTGLGKENSAFMINILWFFRVLGAKNCSFGIER